jgi:hypothetical protein
MRGFSKQEQSRTIELASQEKYKDEPDRFILLYLQSIGWIPYLSYLIKGLSREQ